MTLRTDLAARGIEVGERPKLLNGERHATNYETAHLVTYAGSLERALAEMVRRHPVVSGSVGVFSGIEVYSTLNGCCSLCGVEVPGTSLHACNGRLTRGTRPAPVPPPTQEGAP